MTFCDFCLEMPRSQVFFSFNRTVCSWRISPVLGIMHCAGRRKNRAQSLPYKILYSVRGGSLLGLGRVGFPEEEATIAKMVPPEVNQTVKTAKESRCAEVQTWEEHVWMGRREEKREGRGMRRWGKRWNWTRMPNKGKITAWRGRVKNLAEMSSHRMVDSHKTTKQTTMRACWKTYTMKSKSWFVIFLSPYWSRYISF